MLIIGSWRWKVEQREKEEKFVKKVEHRMGPLKPSQNKTGQDGADANASCYISAPRPSEIRTSYGVPS